ncbi:MAG: hypothetical protein RI580_13400 [Halothece sp. Uz-M2-17]|nr:hypothetical protein [Halothece sp. Uz-M2-17]
MISTFGLSHHTADPTDPTNKSLFSWHECHLLFPTLTISLSIAVCETVLRKSDFSTLVDQNRQDNLINRLQAYTKLNERFVKFSRKNVTCITE